MDDFSSNEEKEIVWVKENIETFINHILCSHKPPDKNASKNLDSIALIEFINSDETETR